MPLGSPLNPGATPLELHVAATPRIFDLNVPRLDDRPSPSGVTVPVVSGPRREHQLDHPNTRILGHDAIQLRTDTSGIGPKPCALPPKCATARYRQERQQ